MRPHLRELSCRGRRRGRYHSALTPD
jgi:hypothetical protein